MSWFRRRARVPFAEWDCRVIDYRLATDGVVQFAQWQHPRVSVQALSQDEIDGLRQFIAPGDFVIDVGAHTGDTATPMGLAAGSTGNVLALEPNPYVFKVLQRNAALNAERTRITPLCLAATETDGTYVFHYGDASFCNGGLSGGWLRNPLRRRYPLSVTGRNLLELLRRDYAEWLPRLSYVKVDAEGYDRAVLASILPVLREFRPVVRTEVFRGLAGQQRRELFDLLADNGYDVCRFQGGAHPAGPRIARSAMTAEKHFDMLALPQSRGKGRVRAA